MNNFSCVLFDLGGVIVNWHNTWLIDEITSKYNINKKNFEIEFEKNLPLLSSGKISEKDFWFEIGTKINSLELTNQNSLLETIFEKFSSTNNKVIYLSKILKDNKLRIGILSNTEPVTYSIINKMIGLDYFDFKFLSYEIGYIKPDLMIYKYVLEKIPVHRQEILFIDDTFHNVLSANKSGIHSIQFLNYEKPVSDLKDLEIL